jgi:predicted ABC-type ATPase
MPPRLRMFAGPNGSGKSTIKTSLETIDSRWLGVYVNPDDIEREISITGMLDFDHFKIKVTRSQILNFLGRSSQLVEKDLAKEVARLEFENSSLYFQDVELNSYYVSAIADFLHERLIKAGTDFSFETVMSHPAKIELLRAARSKGFRNYLYYIATEDPAINISRVTVRVKEGGHDVPDAKVRSRYYRSLQNLIAAIRATDRAYIYDNSGAEAKLIAEITDGRKIEIRNASVPVWFESYVLKNRE